MFCRRRRPFPGTIPNPRGSAARQDIDETAREMIELVTRLDMAVQRHAVELRQDIDGAQTGVQAVADRDID